MTFCVDAIRSVTFISTHKNVSFFGGFFVIITVGVNDAERDGHRSGVAGGIEDTYLLSPETLIKQCSVHITSHRYLGPQRATFVAYLYFTPCTCKYLPCGA